MFFARTMAAPAERNNTKRNKAPFLQHHPLPITARNELSEIDLPSSCATSKISSILTTPTVVPAAQVSHYELRRRYIQNFGICLAKGSFSIRTPNSRL